MKQSDPMENARCGARAKGAGNRQCRNHPLPGQLVCRMHGGSSPQALAKAQDRARKAPWSTQPSPPSPSSSPTTTWRLLAMSSTTPGFRTPEKLEQSGKLVIEVEYVNTPLPATTLQPHHNGHLTTPRN